jgi:ribosomal protein L11 methylase PrmA
VLLKRQEQKIKEKEEEVERLRRALTEKERRVRALEDAREEEDAMGRYRAGTGAAEAFLAVVVRLREELRKALSENEALRSTLTACSYNSSNINDPK